MSASRFVIITGGPGAGKTTLVNALGAAGYLISAEAGRAIIQDQALIGGSALPWADRTLYAELMLASEIRSYRSAMNASGHVLFDRGIPDVLAYLRLIGCDVGEHFARAAQVFRYCKRVFIAPPWPEIFTQDAERKQPFDVAVRTYEALAATYAGLGYELLELPRAAVDERVDFIVDALRGNDEKVP
jgi:predicted ATPase